MMHPKVRAMRKAQRLRDRAIARAAEWENERDRLIRECLAEGMSQEQIRRALDGKISRARVGQIRHRSR